MPRCIVATLARSSPLSCLMPSAPQTWKEVDKDVDDCPPPAITSVGLSGLDKSDDES